MLKVNEKPPPTEKPRKKLSFRDPEVESGVSSSKRYIFGLHPQLDFYNNNCEYVMNRTVSSSKQQQQTLPPVVMGSPRRQSLIQLPPIAAVLKSRTIDVNEEPKEDGAENGCRILNDGSSFEKQLRLLLEKELAVNGRMADDCIDDAASLTMAAGNNQRGRARPSIIIDDADINYEQEKDDIEDDRMTNGSLDDVFLESQAMRIVRTVGQAFEVCHKLSLHHSQQTMDGQDDAISERSSEVIINAEKNRKLKSPADGASEPNSCDTQTEEIPPQDSNSQQQQTQQLLESGAGNITTPCTSTPTSTVNMPRPNRLEPIPPPPESDPSHGTPLTEGETYSSPMSKPLPAFDNLPSAGTPLSTHHQVQLLREQLDQQQQQTQVAIAQVHLLRDQLAAETAARLEVQARIHQLLVHNRELLDHIHRLVLQMKELEAKTQGYDSKTSPQRYQQQQQEYNYTSQIPLTTPSPAPNSFPDYSSFMDPNQAISNMAADQSSLYENHNSNMSGLEASTSPLQMCTSPVPSYGSGGVTPLHYSGSLNRSPSLRQPINANDQLRQVLSNNANSSLFYPQQKSAPYFRSPPNTAPPVILRQLQQTTSNEDFNASGNRLDMSFLDNYSLPMPKLNPPPQRKRPTSRQSSVGGIGGNQQQNLPADDVMAASDVNHCSSSDDLLVKQRLMMMSEQNSKMADALNDKSASDLAQKTLMELGNLSINERNKQQQFLQSNGPASYAVTPPRSAPSTLTTYMDDTNLERLGRMQRMTWTRHTVGK